MEIGNQPALYDCGFVSQTRCFFAHGYTESFRIISWARIMRMREAFLRFVLVTKVLPTYNSEMFKAKNTDIYKQSSSALSSDRLVESPGP